MFGGLDQIPSMFKTALPKLSLTLFVILTTFLHEKSYNGVGWDLRPRRCALRGILRNLISEGDSRGALVNDW